MAGRVGGQPPYGTVLLIQQLTEDPVYAAYVRGRLVLAGVDLSVPAPDWLDAVWAAWVDSPHELLKKAQREVVIATAKIMPDRSTWGLLPEQQKLAGHMAARPGRIG